MATPDEEAEMMERMYDEELEMMAEMQAMEAQQAAAQQYEEAQQQQQLQKEPAPGNPSHNISINSSFAAASPAANQPQQASSQHQSAPGSASARSFFQNSPALSQISLIHADDDDGGGAGPSNAVNRRLFGTPFGGGAAARSRVASTPFGSHPDASSAAFGHQRRPMEPVIPEEGEEVAADGAPSRKRRLEDLFGDIDDIVDEEDGLHGVVHDRIYEALAKRARTEEQIDLDMIAAILERRKQRMAAVNALSALHIDRLEALHRFKQQNLSYALPRWPYTTLRRGAGAMRERVYVRMHSEEFERTQIEEAGGRCGSATGGIGGLLGAEREQIWATAQQLINDRLTASSAEPVKVPAALDETAADILPPESVTLTTDDLWVEKYRPQRYVDLLSDETTNRSLLSWLKMWDKVVFNRDFNLESVAAKHNNHTGSHSAAPNANSFNKKTGKFEAFGRFRNGGAGSAPFVRRAPLGAGQELRTERDEHGRPQQKVVLLCGPPGLGKTTLAHTIARHAGYTVRELNASDDRSPEAFRQALENGTQMQALLVNGVTAATSRPNCIVLDEIDGAPAPAIDFLCKFISDGVTERAAKATTAGAAAVKKRKPTILRRPVICICNDAYAPALRPLRQLAFIVNFSALNSNRLAERLAQIARRERMRADMAALLALAEKTGNDVRACLAVLQFHRNSGGVGPDRPLTLLDVLRSSCGQKDRQRGLFQVWSAIFQIQRPRKQLVTDEMHTDGRQVVAMTDMSATQRCSNVLAAVHMGGDYERLTSGVHENYLAQKQPDPNMRGVVAACEWFCFTDRLRRHIGQTQNYSVFGYQQFAFVAWHFLFGGLAWPKIGFPVRGQEFARKQTAQRQMEQALRLGFSAKTTGGVGSGPAVLLDTVPLLRHVLCPQMRAVSLQLLSPRERADLRHTVEVMADLGLVYVQTKAADGTYQYQMEPNINMMGVFDVVGANAQVAVSYTVRQLIAREVELEKMRRLAPKAAGAPANSLLNTSIASSVQPAKALPNHLRQLPKPMRPPQPSSRRLKETVTKDFFGRLSSRQTSITVQEGGTDVIVKSPIWYRYKEGCNNAVRKDVTIGNLL